jgi:hypothetical protein
MDPDSLPPGVPEHAKQFLIETGYFNEDLLQPGAVTPSVHLRALNGDAVTVGGRGLVRTQVLVFGSYT